MKRLLLFGIALLAWACGVPEDLSVDARRDAVLAQIVPPPVPGTELCVTDFGAVADSVTDCKPAFDAALRRAEREGGAHLIVPPGCYRLCGPIHLVSNLRLDLQEGAVLRFDPEPSYYLPAVATSWEGTFVQNYSPLIYGRDLHNVAIVGRGVIDGNAATTFASWRALQREDSQRLRAMNHEATPVGERVFGEGHYLRPHLIQLYGCRNVLLEDFFVTNSPFWCIHLLQSENITARRVRFDAKLVNNDGFDPEYSRNILIEDIDFNNGDDNVAIKAGRDREGRAEGRPTENIVIRNCRFKGLHGVVIGSEMSAGVRNVFVEDCSFGGYCKRGIYFKSNPDRGGFIRDIYIRNVEFGEVEDAFYITSFYAGEGAGSPYRTEIRDVLVENFRCRRASAAGIVIQGYPDAPVRDVVFRNVRIEEAAIGISMTHAERIEMNDVVVGGEVGVPSQVTAGDRIFGR